MLRKASPAASVMLILCAAAAAVFHWGTARLAAQNDRWGANYFPNVTLTTHEGKAVRFYDDLVKGKIVAINLIYTSCKYACPLETARLAQVQKILGDRVGRDVFFYSISIDPEHDTPAVLKEYSQRYKAGPGWVFLTGARADIELISKKLGLYTPPSAAGADGHKPFLLVGNEATGQWMRNSAMDNPGFLARTIGDWLNSWQTAKKKAAPATYTDAPRIAFDQGQYTFSRQCAACHTIGGGDNIGPDLLGVTAARDRAWLTRFIAAPDKMNAEGDPLAVALRAKYNQARMPNLGLTAEDVAVVLEYIERQSRAARSAAVPERVKPAAAAPRVMAAALATKSVDLMPLLGPYLVIQRSLAADSLPSVQQSASGVGAAAAKLGSEGEAIESAARRLQQAQGLANVRAAFADLSDAILQYSKSMRGGLPAGVKVAYCPMAGKHWLQDGDEIRNPFHGAAMSACGRFVDRETLKSEL